MRLMKAAVLSGVAALASPSLAVAQSITPATTVATMTVGQTITINKTITLGASGANLVDLFFLADNTGSMSGIVGNAQSGANQILGNVPAGASYNFGVGRYLGDPSEGISPATAYTQITPLGPSAANAQAGINTWFASGGGDYPEGNFFALEQVATTAAWRPGSQRIVIWFGDAPAHTATTSQADAIAALQAADATVVAFNRIGANQGMDEGGQASAVATATGGSLQNNFGSLSSAQFVAAVNSAITAATSSLDLVFGSSLVGNGLTLAFTCTDALGCDDVAGGESRTFDLSITANTPGVYDFTVFAAGVSATEHDIITVLGPSSVVPEPSTWVLLATGLFGIGFFSRRRKGMEHAL
jgi:hypothetical protein